MIKIREQKIAVTVDYQSPIEMQLPPLGDFNISPAINSVNIRPSEVEHGRSKERVEIQFVDLDPFWDMIYDHRAIEKLLKSDYRPITAKELVALLVQAPGVLALEGSAVVALGSVWQGMRGGKPESYYPRARHYEGGTRYISDHGIGMLITTDRIAVVKKEQLRLPVVPTWLYDTEVIELGDVLVDPAQIRSAYKQMFSPELDQVKWFGVTGLDEDADSYYQKMALIRFRSQNHRSSRVVRFDEVELHDVNTEMLNELLANHGWGALGFPEMVAVHHLQHVFFPEITLFFAIRDYLQLPDSGDRYNMPLLARNSPARIKLSQYHMGDEWLDQWVLVGGPITKTA